jgi:hypothetical protein
MRCQADATASLRCANADLRSEVAALRDRLERELASERQLIAAEALAQQVRVSARHVALVEPCRLVRTVAGSGRALRLHSGPCAQQL